MSNQLELTGKIINIGETQTFASGFQKRTFVLNDGNEKYPQEIAFDATKDGCTKLDSYRIGDEVTVGFNIRGNSHNGRWFVNLQAWKLTKVGGEQRSANQGGATPPARDNSAVDNMEDDIPFNLPNLIWP